MITGITYPISTKLSLFSLPFQKGRLPMRIAGTEYSAVITSHSFKISRPVRLMACSAISLYNKRSNESEKNTKEPGSALWFHRAAARHHLSFLLSFAHGGHPVSKRQDRADGRCGLMRGHDKTVPTLPFEGGNDDADFHVSSGASGSRRFGGCGEESFAAEDLPGPTGRRPNIPRAGVRGGADRTRTSRD